ncbi:hypothetical protein C8R42DRAFT_645788 [Lentinula raphanica]|nr:hypothetical protein C8R42DRAFT_645788 [Lentinula raphanica]
MSESRRQFGTVWFRFPNIEQVELAPIIRTASCMQTTFFIFCSLSQNHPSLISLSHCYNQVNPVQLRRSYYCNMKHDSGIFEYLHGFGDDDHSTLSSENSGLNTLNDLPACDFASLLEDTLLCLEGPFEESLLYPTGPFRIYPGINKDKDNVNAFLLSPLSPLSAYTLSPGTSTSGCSESTTLEPPFFELASPLDSLIALGSPFSRQTSPPESVPSDSISGSGLSDPPESIAMTCCSPEDIFCDLDLSEGSNDSTYFSKENNCSKIEVNTELELFAFHNLCSPSRIECDQGCCKLPSTSSPAPFIPSDSMKLEDNPEFTKRVKKNRDEKQDLPTNTSLLSSAQHSRTLSLSPSISKSSTSSDTSSMISNIELKETEIPYRLVGIASHMHHRTAKQAVIYQDVYSDIDDGDDFLDYEDGDDEYDDDEEINISSRKRKRRLNYSHKHPSLSYLNVAAGKQQYSKEKARMNVNVGFLNCGPSYHGSSEEQPTSTNRKRKRGTKIGKRQQRRFSNKKAKNPENMGLVVCPECGDTFTRGYDLSRHHISIHQMLEEQDEADVVKHQCPFCLKLLHDLMLARGTLTELKNVKGKDSNRSRTNQILAN